MTITTIYWGDGTSDVITVTFTGDVGSSQMAVASDPNRYPVQRQKVIKLKSTGGVQLGTLTVTQQAYSRSYTIEYANEYS